jgi:glutamate racemase
VLRALRAALPRYDFLFLGDSGRSPYGGRDVDTVLDFSEQCIEQLLDAGCRLIVVACHTVSCTALRHLQLRYAPSADGPRRILGVTIPTAEEAVSVSRGHIGVIGTRRTIASGTFATEIAKLGSHKVSAFAAPLLVPIVEESWHDSAIAREAVERYVSRFEGIDTLVLGCTHYPLLLSAFEAAVPPGVKVLDPSPAVAARLCAWLERHPGFEDEGTGRLHVLCTGDPRAFREAGALFLGEPLGPVQQVVEERSRLVPRDAVSAPIGQIVRPHGGSSRSA